MPQPRPTSNAVCSCGKHLRWEARQSNYGTRWLATCANPECGEVVIVRVDGDPTGLEDFLLDRPPEPYKAPWVRLFLQATTIARWRGADTCPDCSGQLAFRTNFPMTRERRDDPFEIVLCLDCGRTQMSIWSPPNGLHTTVLPGQAWEGPDDPIIALTQAVRQRVAAPRSDAE